MRRESKEFKAWMDRNPDATRDPYYGGVVYRDTTTGGWFDKSYAVSEYEDQDPNQAERWLG